MSKVLGIDPGNSGALAIYDDVANTLDIVDMPVWYQTTGKKKRPRIDGVELRDFMEAMVDCGVELAVIEAVGGRPGQAGAAAFVFGYGVGLVYQACVCARLPIETVPPVSWKKIMRCPKDDAGIAHRADEVFPTFTHLWRGTPRKHKGEMRTAIWHDRAEAALLAKFGCVHIMKSAAPALKSEADLASYYRRAETGG